MNIDFRLYRNHENWLGSGNPCRLVQLYSSSRVHENDLFTSSNVVEGSLFFEFRLDGVETNRYSRDFTRLFGDYVFELVISSGKDRVLPENILTSDMDTALFPSLRIE